MIKFYYVILSISFFLCSCVTSQSNSIIAEHNNLNSYKYVIVEYPVYLDGTYDKYNLGSYTEQELKKIGFNVVKTGDIQSLNKSALLKCVINHNHAPDGWGGSYANVKIELIDNENNTIYQGFGRYQGITITHDLVGATEKALNDLYEYYTGYKIITADIDTKSKKTVDNNLKQENYDFGNYFALVIGNNNYMNMPLLNTAINDATSVAEILKTKYNFNVSLILDATRNDILLSLSKFRDQLKENDNLIIYYAGHGWLDVESDQGYWLPIDSEENNIINWISNTTITSQVRAIKAKKVLIVSDSCYSGTLNRGLTVIPQESTQELLRRRTRVVISSGGLEPVEDVYNNTNNSVFAYYFIQELLKNQEIITSSELFKSIKEPVQSNSDQTPEYSNLIKSGHEGGDFIFYPNQ